ncbi:MAG TPA: sigma-70 family RNA polymerase sigma factor [Candidatus Limnocylindria bacterium]|nr:sigma-70 family RNA polymerase sigma factor [Candidatus Limnocylindria bacterium]
MASSDWDLVQQARRGDREAFRALVERYQHKVTALATGMLRNRDDALDVVQDTFTKAYQSLDRFKGESSFYTWLYRITLNQCIDYQRRAARMPSAPLEASETPEESPTINAARDDAGRDDPLQRVHEVEVGQRIRQAIDELTPEHRAVILLREVEGLSYEEISRALECPKGTVMSRLHYARRQLQARLRGLL